MFPVILPNHGRFEHADGIIGWLTTMERSSAYGIGPFQYTEDSDAPLLGYVATQGHAAVLQLLQPVRGSDLMATAEKISEVEVKVKYYAGTEASGTVRGPTG